MKDFVLRSIGDYLLNAFFLIPNLALVFSFCRIKKFIRISIYFKV